MLRQVLLMVMVVVCGAQTTPSTNSTEPKSSGLLYITADQKLRFGENSILIVTPTLSLPGRLMTDHYGASSSQTFSFPIKIDFEAIGLTIGSPGSGSGSGVAAAYSDNSTRVNTFKYLEMWVGMGGLDGHGCMLRTICEAAHTPFQGYSFMGEMLQLFLSPSQSNELGLEEYVAAETAGKSTEPTACQAYHTACPYSFF